LADRALDPGDEVGGILFGTGFGGITDVKVGPDGYLYVLTFQDGGGSIYRIVPEDVDTDDDEADGDTDEAEIEETTDDTGAPTLAQTLVERITRDVISQ
jgi:hypothetical protein